MSHLEKLKFYDFKKHKLHNLEKQKISIPSLELLFLKIIVLILENIYFKYQVSGSTFFIDSVSNLENLSVEMAFFGDRLNS